MFSGSFVLQRYHPKNMLGFPQSTKKLKHRVLMVICLEPNTDKGKHLTNYPCYRDPRWPDTAYPRKMPKKYPWPEILAPVNTPTIPENKTKRALLVFRGCFSGYFWRIFWGSRLSCRAFFVELPGPAISGLSRGGFLN